MNKSYFLSILIFIFSCSPQQGNKSLEETPQKLEYKAELVGTKQYDTIQNFYFLVTTMDTSKGGMESIAKELKEKHCTIKCNIDLYDDKQAYFLSMEKDSINISWNAQLDQNEITLKQYKEKFDEWNAKNYCYMANHHLGRYTYDNFYWPYLLIKESTYKELCK